MWAKKNTSIYGKNEAGEEIQLYPIFFCSDSDNRKVIISEMRTSTSKKIIPFLLPQEIAKGETKPLSVVLRKQKFTKGKKAYDEKELSFRTEIQTMGYVFYVCKKAGVIKRSWAIVLNVFNAFRKWLKSVREKNPQRYDSFTKYTWIIWETIIAALGLFSGLSSDWITITACVFFAIVMGFQLGSERNRTDRLLEESQQKHDKEIMRTNKEGGEKIEKAQKIAAELEYRYQLTIIEEKKALAKIEHEAAHRAKHCITDIRRMETREDCLDKLAEFLKKCADDLEDQLSHYYNKDICVSFKLADSESTVKTYTRGKNNIKNRKIIGLPSSEKPKDISKNTAYNHIFSNEKHNCYHCGDLRNVRFSCERDNWQEYFKATIVIPIRWNIPHSDEYQIAGIVCVDCNEIVDDWNSPSSFGYQLTAFFADLLFMPLCEIANPY